MNTRRKMVQPKPAAPSKRWHLMHETYHNIFTTEARTHVEDWYNLGATGVQRDYFRAICAEIYKQDGSLPDPAQISQYTATVKGEEADLMVKYYTKVLTPEGKRKARAWIVRQTADRPKDTFRDVFAGCQTVLEKQSVMHHDFTPPEGQYYPEDRTHFNRSVDWTSLKARKNMQALQAQRTNGDVAEPTVKTTTAAEAARLLSSNAEPRASPSPALSPMGANGSGLTYKRPTIVVEELTRQDRGRVTKPKNQFDGVNNLAFLGYGDDVPTEVAVAELRAKHHAYAQEKAYYVDKDGSTVYVAANVTTSTVSCRPETKSVGGGGILAAVTSEPISQWKVKICDY